MVHLHESSIGLGDVVVHVSLQLLDSKGILGSGSVSGLDAAVAGNAAFIILIHALHHFLQRSNRILNPLLGLGFRI